MIKTESQPNAASRARSALVLASSIFAVSMTTSLPSACFAESAGRRARCRRLPDCRDCAPGASWLGCLTLGLGLRRLRLGGLVLGLRRRLVAAAQRRRERQPLRRLLLDGVLDEDPALLAPRH